MSTFLGIKNSLLLILEKCILLCFVFFNSVLLARIAGPDAFGQYAYILSIASLFLPLCIMGLNNIVTKYIVKNPSNAHYYLKSALVVRLSGAILSLVLGLMLVLVLNSQHSKLIILLILLQSFSVFYVIEFYFLAKQQVTILLKIRTFTLIALNIVKCIVILNGSSLNLLITLQGLEYVLIGGSYVFVYIHGKHHNLIKRNTSKRSYLALAQKGKWLLFSGIAATIYLKIDQIMLANLLDTHAVAYYAAASKLSEVWYVFPVLIANAFTAQLSHLKSNSDLKYHTLLQQLIATLTVTALLLSIATYFIAPTLISLIYGDQYSSSATILSIHIFASIFIFQRAILSKWLIIERLYKYSLVSSLCGAVTNIVLNALLIPKYAGVGAAWATVISYMVASYGFLFLQTKTKAYAQILHQAMLNSPALFKSLVLQIRLLKK
ncbi:flippase [Pseudoalteromonas distincta]|uniref:flippase n=1 Tax=Pseudoalteromonas distincta TaxID=77608 RepID=UPI0023427E3E|nr:flippase [Pseudoalteromonas distincta]MDC3212131.1 flippase [Pseudoalteromonas distincta]